MNFFPFMILRFMLFYSLMASPLLGAIYLPPIFLDSHESLHGLKWIMAFPGLGWIFGVGWMANDTASHLIFEKQSLHNLLISPFTRHAFIFRSSSSWVIGSRHLIAMTKAQTMKADACRIACRMKNSARIRTGRACTTHWALTRRPPSPPQNPERIRSYQPRVRGTSNPGKIAPKKHPLPSDGRGIKGEGSHKLPPEED